MAEAVFDLPMKQFRQIGPSKEEFVLILALLFTNSGINKNSQILGIIVKIQITFYNIYNNINMKYKIFNL